MNTHRDSSNSGNYEISDATLVAIKKLLAREFKSQQKNQVDDFLKGEVFKQLFFEQMKNVKAEAKSNRNVKPKAIAKKKKVAKSKATVNSEKSHRTIKPSSKPIIYSNYREKYNPRTKEVKMVACAEIAKQLDISRQGMESRCESRGVERIKIGSRWHVRASDVYKLK